ncbi:hypothetical protein EDC01DRAFT_405615 [Geopyxis carbonaria]|nr:hypothetical protein EDC01DRAFT_405615 [Geopyxis carbonaria]
MDGSVSVMWVWVSGWSLIALFLLFVFSSCTIHTSMPLSTLYVQHVLPNVATPVHSFPHLQRDLATAIPASTTCPARTNVLPCHWRTATAIVGLNTFRAARSTTRPPAAFSSFHVLP